MRDDEIADVATLRGGFRQSENASLGSKRLRSRLADPLGARLYSTYAAATKDPRNADIECFAKPAVLGHVVIASHQPLPRLHAILGSDNALLLHHLDDPRRPIVADAQVSLDH